MEAAKATFVDRFVRALPDGYNTVIDEEGNNVSAGEKQLITIARAFVANPSLLILDEATSSVDTRTEVLVQKAMAALRTDRTSFVIADPGVVRRDFVAAGFALDSESDVLRNPSDDHSLSVFNATVIGRTDRFVLRFRKR